MSASVNYLGIRQNRLNKPHIRKIIGHFVGEKWGCIAVAPRLQKVLLTQLADRSHRQIGDALGENLAGSLLGQTLGDHGDVGQFASAIHLRVAR